MKNKSFVEIRKVIAVYLAIIIVWQFSYWIFVEQFSLVKPYIFPSPLGIINTLKRLIESKLLLLALFNSFRKIFIGIIISIALGLILSVQYLVYVLLSNRL